MTNDPFGAPGAQSQRAEDRVKRDRWKRYLLPDPETGEEVAWTRVSTIKGCIANTFNLELWKQRQVALGLSLRPDLLTLAASVAGLPPGDKQAKETLNNVCRQAQDAAGSRAGANLGTALHTATERLDRGERLDAISLPAPYDADLRAYDEARRAAGMVTQPEHIERIVVIPQLQVAGTLDRLTFWRGGRRVLDVKTGQDASEFGQLELAVQMALYANAAYMWNLDTEQYEPMPEVAKDWAILAHLPAGGGRCDFYPVNIAAGWEAAQLAAAVHAARKGERELVGAVFPIGTLPAAELVQQARATQDERMNPQASQLALHRSQLENALTTARDHDTLIGISKTVAEMPGGELIWTDELRALAARRWDELSDAAFAAVESGMRLESVSAVLDPPPATAGAYTVNGIGGPSLFAKRVLNARTREELGALYEEGMASHEWTEEIGALAFAVMAAYVEPCPATTAPHGDTLACGCGYKRPELLDA